MADIELRLIAHNDEYITNIKEAQTAHQTFNDNFKAGEASKQQLLTETNNDISQQGKNLDYNAKVVGKISTSLRAELKKISEELIKMDAAGQRGTKAFDDLLKKAGKLADEAGTKPQSLRAELRNVREEMMKMEIAGQRGTAAFTQLANRAGELADQAGDTQQRIKILASDTKNLDAAMSVGTGLAGGFAVAEGAMALFGKEGENLQRQLVKLQGGMNLLNGLQSVANVLNKDSAARVVLAAKAQQLYTLVVGTSTGALKAFKIALATTGIGLIVVAIGALVANWDKLTAAIFNSNKELDEFDSKIKDNEMSLHTLNAVLSETISKRNDEIALLEAKGGNEEEIYKKSVENLKDEKRLLAENISLLEQQAKKQEWIMNSAYMKGDKVAYEEELKKLTDIDNSLNDVKNKYNSLDTQIQILTITEQKRLDKIKEDEESKTLKKRQEKYQKFVDLLKQLTEKEQAARLSMLSGKARINAEEKLQLDEIDMLKKHLKELGKLNEEQYAQIKTVEDGIRKKAEEERKKFDEERKKFDEEEAKKETEKNDKLRDLQRKNEEDKLELIEAGEEKKLKLKLEFLEEDLITQSKIKGQESKLLQDNLNIQIGIVKNAIAKLKTEKGFSLWKVLGIDPNTKEGKLAVESINKNASVIMDSVGQIMDAELAQAEQHTQNIQTRLDEAEAALDKELELQKEGLANNVDAKKKEIEQIQAEKAKALEEEKKLQQAQQLLDTTTQISSLITAAANIFKGFSKIPLIGQILAIAAVASMFTAFAAAKAQASQITKMEQGGYGDSTGVVKGKRHSGGGEKFSDHIEVEDGEAWAVWNRSATQKFGNFIPYMVDSMNNLKFPNLNMTSPGTVVNIDTKKMQSKLDDINQGIKVLNDNLLNTGDVFYAGKSKVIKLNNNHIRIVHGKN